MDKEFDGIMICCPKCDWQPFNELFFKLSIDAYDRSLDKRINIKCGKYLCNYSGFIENWLFIFKQL